MNSQSDNFEHIRKLLALKRYEQPPPGYFDQLSARILNRIESSDAGQTTLWERLGFAFGSKPAFVCALGVVVCGLLCIGLLSTIQDTTASGMAVSSQLAYGSESVPVISAPEVARSSVEPVINEVSPFRQTGHRAEKVSYAPTH